MDESSVELVEGAKATERVEKTPEELVAKAIAPVKREFLRPPPVRPSNDVVSDSKSTPSTLVKEKKSKRQLKRERRQEQKSALNLCSEIAKTGNVSACPYNENCRFSHDLEGYKAQKPADLEGNCPFTSADRACPYGLACRFSGTHKDGVAAGNLQKKNSEINGLNKDVQKLLWKNKKRFPKADAKLKLLGLLGKANSKIKACEDKEEGDLTVSNCNHAINDNSCGDMATDSDNKVEGSPKLPEEDDEPRPTKKAKSAVDEEYCTGKEDNVYKHVFLPLLIKNHWTLIVFDLYKLRIQLLDSLGGRKKTHMTGAQNNLAKVVLCLMAHKKGGGEFNLERFSFVMPDVPSQTNEHDCGVFAMKFMELWSSGGLTKSIDPTQMSKYRLKILGNMLLSQHNAHRTMFQK